MRLELRHVALTTGDSVTGAVVLRLPAAARIDSLVVTASGRELLHPANRYAPFVYTTPVPRPWGRSRTGALRLDFATVQPLVGELVGQDATLRIDDRPSAPVGDYPAGEHAWPFALPIPPEALPTYGGIHALVEHEVLVTAVIDGRKSEAWRPLHVWQPGRIPPPRPVTIAAPAEPRGLLDRLVAPARAPLKLAVHLPSETLDLWQPLVGLIELENPEQVALGPVALELVGVEQVRHMSATDQHEVVISRHIIKLSDRPKVTERFEHALPRTLAPALRSPRFRLDWVLRATVTVPWGLGIAGQAKVVLRDGGGAVRAAVDEGRAQAGSEEL